MINPKRFAGLMLCTFFAAVAGADVKLPAIIGENMVLQQEKPVPIWGWADPSEQVTVSFGDQTKTATADSSGKWMVKLDALKAGATGKLKVTGKNTLTLDNILVGEVWICSGQSNMGFIVRSAHNASVVVPASTNPRIRLFSVALTTSPEPQKDCKGKWVECNPETVPNFTAAGYFFGRDIHKALGLPVGLINTSWGGTPAQAWTSLEGLKREPSLDVYVKSYENVVTNAAKLDDQWQKQAIPRWEEAVKKWQQEHGQAYKEQIAQWQKQANAAKATGQLVPPAPQPAVRQPRKPDQPSKSQHNPSFLYNAMIHPLAPLAIRGAIWYQGESNAGNPQQYRTLFPAMITDWRRVFGQGDFPFLWVQLANYMKRESEPTQGGDNGWPGLREAQSMTLKLPNTGQAVIIDIGEGDDIHPLNKDDVGKRLALAGLRVAYGKNIVSSGPTYAGLSMDGSKARVKFQNVGGGLVIGTAPPIRLNQAPSKPLDHLVGFSIAGEDRKFVWAQAKIEGDSVVVWSDGVSKPVAVRYAWANNPECNLYNAEGLPASPFRTDDWVSNPPQTQKK